MKISSSIRHKLASILNPQVVCFDDAFPDVEKHIILDQISVPTPETGGMKIHAFMDYIDNDIYKSPEVFTSILKDVKFEPISSSVITRDGSVLGESTGPGARGLQTHQHALRVKRNQRSNRISGYCTALQCQFYDHYHFLVDNLSRFHLLTQPYFRDFDEIKLLVPSDLSPAYSFFIERLAPRNVLIEWLESDKMYHIDNYVFNSFVTRLGSGFVHRSFVDDIREKICDKTKGPRRKKIYISRNKAKKGRRVLNEQYLMDVLSKFGFEKYILEDMDIKDQVATLNDAKWVIGPHGAGLANLLFARDTRVIEMFPSEYVVPHYYMLCKAMDHSYSYVCGTEDHHDRDFNVDVEQVVSVIRQMN